MPLKMETHKLTTALHKRRLLWKRIWRKMRVMGFASRKILKAKPSIASENALLERRVGMLASLTSVPARGLIL